MKALLLTSLAFGALAAHAFDSEAWLAKRALLEQEADRLRQAYAMCVARQAVPAEDVTLPIETFPDGSVKISVHADKAVYFLKEGFIWASGVVVRKLDAEGAEDTRIVAESCVIDRHTKSGWAQGRASVTHGKSVLAGENVYFSSPEGYVMVTRAADMRTGDLKVTGGLL